MKMLINLLSCFVPDKNKRKEIRSKYIKSKERRKKLLGYGCKLEGDVGEGLPFLPDNCVDEIHCRSVLEHMQNFETLLSEIVRVLKPAGRAHIFVPHFSNPYYYSDYTHKRFFGLYSFFYFTEPQHQLKKERCHVFIQIYE